MLKSLINFIPFFSVCVYFEPALPKTVELAGKLSTGSIACVVYQTITRNRHKLVTIGSGIRFKTHIGYPKLVRLRMPAPNVRQGIIFNVFSYLPINIFLNVQRFHSFLITYSNSVIIRFSRSDNSQTMTVACFAACS